MGYCPSQDWDRHIAGEESQAESERAFWFVNKDRVITIAAAILSNPNVDPFKMGESDVIEQAGKIVARLMMDKCGEEF